jgi:hypothetical protein
MKKFFLIIALSSVVVMALIKRQSNEVIKAWK